MATHYNNRRALEILGTFDTEVRAALDAFNFLLLSPDMPTPVVEEMLAADWGADAGVALTWRHKANDLYFRAEFTGDGLYCWYFSLGSIEKSGDKVGVTKGAPEQVPSVLNSLMKENA